MIKKILLGLSLFPVLAVLAIFLWPEKGYKPYQVDAAYQSQVDEFIVPEFPKDWTWYSYATGDNVALRWGETGNRDAAKATIIWVPGYTATLSMYGEHFDLLARKGYHVLGLDLRGQGGSQRYRNSQPEKLWIDDFHDYTKDVEEWLVSQNLPQDRPVILSGSSFGGHVVARAAGDHDLPINALYLIAPAFKPQSTPYSFEQAMRLMQISRKLGKAKNYVQGQDNWKPDGLDFTKDSPCSSYPKRLYLRDAIFANDPKERVGGVTNQWGAEFFESSQYINNPEFLAKLNMPVTIISASDDVFVVTEENSKACSEFISNCEEVVIPKTRHCLPQENDAVVVQMMDEFDRLLERIKYVNLAE